MPLERNAADEALAKAVDATVAVPSFHLGSTLDYAGGYDGMVSVQGDMDYARHVGEFRYALVTPDFDGNLTVRADGKHLWLEPRDLGVRLPEDKTWVATTPDRLDRDEALGPRAVLGAVLALRASAGAEVGETLEIDEVPCIRYDTLVDAADVVRTLGPDAGEFERALPLPSPVPPQLRISAWVGPDDVIRQFQLKIIDDTDFDLRGTLHFALRTGLDPDPTPVAPPASDVVTGAAAEEIAQQIFD